MLVCDVYTRRTCTCASMVWCVQCACVWYAVYGMRCVVCACVWCEVCAGVRCGVRCVVCVCVVCACVVCAVCVHGVWCVLCVQCGVCVCSVWCMVCVCAVCAVCAGVCPHRWVHHIVGFVEWGHLNLADIGVGCVVQAIS